MEETQVKPAPQPEATDLQAEVDSLRRLVVSVLILLIVLSATGDIYLFRQVKQSREDLRSIRPQVSGMIAEYQKNSEPFMRDFLNKMAEYGRTHPDFAPILSKYSIRPAGATGAPPATVTPPKTAPKK